MEKQYHQKNRLAPLSRCLPLPYNITAHFLHVLFYSALGNPSPISRWVTRRAGDTMSNKVTRQSLCSVSTACYALIGGYTPRPEYPRHAEATVFSSRFTEDWQPDTHGSAAQTCQSLRCVCVCVFVGITRGTPHCVSTCVGLKGPHGNFFPQSYLHLQEVYYPFWK